MNEWIEKGITNFSRLSSREQWLVSAMAIVFLVAFLTLGVVGTKRSISKKRKALASKVEKLSEVHALRGGYQARLAAQNALAEEIKQNSSLQLLSYLESAANKSQVNLSNARERPISKTQSDVVKEELAVVTLKDVSLDRLYGFLRAVEDGNRLVVVRRLSIKKRFENQKHLDAEVTAGTFKYAGGV